MIKLILILAGAYFSSCNAQPFSESGDPIINAGNGKKKDPVTTILSYQNHDPGEPIIIANPKKKDVKTTTLLVSNDTGGTAVGGTVTLGGKKQDFTYSDTGGRGTSSTGDNTGGSVTLGTGNTGGRNGSGTSTTTEQAFTFMPDDNNPSGGNGAIIGNGGTKRDWPVCYDTGGRGGSTTIGESGSTVVSSGSTAGTLGGGKKQNFC